MVLYRVNSSEVFHLIPQRDFAKEKYEKQLEDWIIKNPSIITEGETILFIKREKALEKSEDLLGIDEEGNTIIVELKRGRTPRAVIAQALEYAARVKRMDYETVDKIARKHFSETGQGYDSLYQAYTDCFGVTDQEILERKINSRQRIFIVGQDISEDVLSMADYLRTFGVGISCVSFRYYKEGAHIIVDIDPDMRASWEEPMAITPHSISSGTGKFLLNMRERIMENHEDKIFYATKKPNRVLSFTLDPEWKVSVALMLESGGLLKVYTTINYDDSDKTIEIAKLLFSRFKEQGQKAIIGEHKGSKHQIEMTLEWNEELLIDSTFEEQVHKTLDLWVKIAAELVQPDE